MLWEFNVVHLSLRLILGSQTVWIGQNILQYPFIGELYTMPRNCE